jgi:outer membrane protein TolC
MLRSTFTLLASLAAAGCVAYDEDPTDVAALVEQARQRPGGPLTCAQAIEAALQENPDLLALEAKARAAGAVTQPLDVRAEYRGDPNTLAVMLDPIALLGLGPRGGAIGVDDAAAAAAVAQLAEARWRTAAAVAEAFALERELRALQVPAIDVDASAFERAGLASSDAIARLQAARASAASEAIETSLERERNRARLRTLLGLLPGTSVEFADGGEPLVEQPPESDEAVWTRPDLALAKARLAVADAEFRRAVSDLYPSLLIGPEFELNGGRADLMAFVTVPFGMAGRAEAARARREAARAELAAACVRAGNDAHTAQLELGAAEAAADAAAHRLSASERSLATALAALRVEVDAFDRAADAAAMAVTAAMERRASVTQLVRARVARAVAFGWPVQHETEGGAS